MYYKDICDKIDELREGRGLSRREIARRAGINENTFGSYFKRKRGNFPEEQIESVARVLEVSPATLKGANLRVLEKPSATPEEDKNKITFDTQKVVDHIWETDSKKRQEADLLSAASIIESIFSDDDQENARTASSNTDKIVYEIMFAMKKLDANDLRFLRAHIDYLLSKDK